ncbi:DNA repair protein RecN [Alkanindiges sp. WGS2144]|uniref:DNA repair protein RecN n=1 Tax=Alkanindiges sp. WGS2144 TaxID=3366808 RepID=UPI003752EB1E
MLTNLTLQNFALADQLSVDLANGFNVLTGETGAGKSLLLDALSVCLGERTDVAHVRFGTDKADVTASFEYQKNDPIDVWLAERELAEGTHEEFGEIHLRRVILNNGRSKAWINGRPSSLTELKEAGRLLVQLYSQHSQQQLLEPPYPKNWLDRYSGFQAKAQEVRQAYHHWQHLLKEQQSALAAAASRQSRMIELEVQLEEILPLTQLNYTELEQEYDRLSHFESMMQDCAALLDGLDEQDNNVMQQLAMFSRRAESQASRSAQLSEVSERLINAQSELGDAVALLRQFVDQQNFDPERMAELNEHLEVFHRLARKYRVSPPELTGLLNSWQTELDRLNLLDDPEALAAQVNQAREQFLQLAQQLDTARREAAMPLADALTRQVRPLALPEAHFEFGFDTLDVPNADGLSAIQLYFTANKGIPAQALARVASGGELSRIALVMQVMNAEKTEADVLVFDEVDVGISGGTAEIVGRLLRDLGRHVQILCITHQPQVAAQADQHLLVEKQQTEQASSIIYELGEEQRIIELARMSGGVEITETTLQHARHLLNLKHATDHPTH